MSCLSLYWSCFILVHISSRLVFVSSRLVLSCLVLSCISDIVHCISADVDQSATTFPPWSCSRFSLVLSCLVLFFRAMSCHVMSCHCAFAYVLCCAVLSFFVLALTCSCLGSRTCHTRDTRQDEVIPRQDKTNARTKIDKTRQRFSPILNQSHEWDRQTSLKSCLVINRRTSLHINSHIHSYSVINENKGQPRLEYRQYHQRTYPPPPSLFHPLTGLFYLGVCI